MLKFRHRIFSMLYSSSDMNTASKLFDIFTLILIILNTFAVILGTFSGLDTRFISFLTTFEIISVLIFTLEYLMRIFTADFLYPDKPPLVAVARYMISWQAIIDLLAILPFYAPLLIPMDLRTLRLLRLIKIFRLFKVNRYTQSFAIIGRVIKRNGSQLLSSVFVVMLLIVISSILMFNVEHTAQPDVFKNIFSAFWWAIATLTTVGYGDIYPVTALGKVFSAVIALLGIGLVALPTGIISSGFIEELSEKDAVKDKKFCPYCGENLGD